MKKIKNNVIRIASDVARELENKGEKKAQEFNLGDDKWNWSTILREILGLPERRPYSKQKEELMKNGKLSKITRRPGERPPTR